MYDNERLDAPHKGFNIRRPDTTVSGQHVTIMLRHKRRVDNCDIVLRLIHESGSGKGVYPRNRVLCVRIIGISQFPALSRSYTSSYTRVGRY